MPVIFASKRATRLTGMSDSQLRSGGGGSEPVVCAYPLDDDGSLSAQFGHIYAGPAVGDDQQSMDYTAAVDGAAVLLPAGLLTTARFSRPASGYVAVEAVVTATEATCGGSLVAVISNASGDIVNVASINGNNGSLDTLAVTIADDGTVTAYKNEEAMEAPEWLFPGAEVVGPTDKVSFGLGANTFTLTGDRVAMTLRTAASDITGSYGAGGKDVCGNALA
jgi:hypothetical protein